MRKLDTFNTVVYTLTAITVAIILYFVIGYWIAGRVPRRPKTVSENAVFLWGPHVGLPAPRHGWWLVCWHAEGKNRCRQSSIDGKTLHEGDFIPYRKNVPLASGNLKIMARETERSSFISVETVSVPFVHLEGGEILLPAARYDEAKRRLDELESRREELRRDPNK